MDTAQPISCRVDYFRATTQHLKTIQNITQEFYRDDTTEQTVPFYGYKHALKELQTGAVCLFGGHTASMGYCSQFGGSAITALMEGYGHGSASALRSVHSGEWKVTRIDVALDVYTQSLSPQSFLDRMASGSVTSPLRAWREVKGLKASDGHTVYGGGTEGEKQLRIYDKSAESGIGKDWTRYEMVFNGQRAREVWELISGCNTDMELLPIAKQLLASVVSVTDWREWSNTLGVGAEYQWTPIPRVESATWKWLLSQVMPTFRDAFDKDGDWSLLERFINEVKSGS